METEPKAGETLWLMSKSQGMLAGRRVVRTYGLIYVDAAGMPIKDVTAWTYPVAMDETE